MTIMKRTHLLPMRDVQISDREGERDGREFAPLSPHLQWQVLMVDVQKVTWISAEKIEEFQGRCRNLESLLGEGVVLEVTHGMAVVVVAIAKVLAVVECLSWLIISETWMKTLMRYRPPPLNR